uniref:Uncharacterized protein n=1 Tax=Rhodnius prolixus TaxID=13249 RepID=A0A4P6DB08_RHOPR
MPGKFICKQDDSLVVRYSHFTRVGNWLEDSLASEEFIGNYSSVLNENKTLYQEHIKKLNKEIQLATTTPSQTKLFSGDRIFLVNPYTETPDAEENDQEQGNVAGLTLSIIFTPADYEFTDKVIPGMLVNGVTHLIPTIRNTFVIEKVGEKEEAHTAINYGDHISFSPQDTHFDSKWYLECRPPNHFSGTLGRSQKVQLRISPFFNLYSRWKIVNIDPHLRTLPFKAPANADVIIQHVATNHSLCALGNWTVQTFYKECDVTIEQKEDIYRRPLPSNVWRICNAIQPGHWHKFVKHQERNRQIEQMELLREKQQYPLTQQQTSSASSDRPCKFIIHKDAN